MNWDVYGLILKSLKEPNNKEFSVKNQSLTLKKISIKTSWSDDNNLFYFELNNW